MSDLLGTLLLALAAAGLLTLVWWLFIASEGVYLGRRTVIWLYDLFASRYDTIKRYHPEYEQWLLAQPIMEAVAPHESPLVLDVATGTGRLPLALLSNPIFQGRVVGIDLSRPMLHIAAEKLAPAADWVSLIWCPAENLPFAEDTFDVVTSLESLEFMMQPALVVAELVRVLRPGGLLLITSRVNTRLMPGKLWSNHEIEQMLASLKIESVKIEIWQADYHKVWGRKAGQSPVTGARPLDEILRCPRCRAQLMMKQDGLWRCENCDGKATIGSDGVIDLFPLYQAKD